MHETRRIIREKHAYKIIIIYPKKASEGLKHCTESKTDTILTLQKVHHHGWLTIKTNKLTCRVVHPLERHGSYHQSSYP